MVNIKQSLQNIYLEGSSEKVALLDLIFRGCHIFGLEAEDRGKFGLGFAAGAEVSDEQCLVDGGWRHEDVLVDPGRVEILEGEEQRLRLFYPAWLRKGTFLDDNNPSQVVEITT